MKGIILAGGSGTRTEQDVPKQFSAFGFGLPLQSGVCLFFYALSHRFPPRPEECIS